MTDSLQTQLIQSRILPVLRYKDAETALYAADIAIRAGFSAIELTWTIPDVLDVVRNLRQRHGTSVLLGVGTLMFVEDAVASLNAGADFLVSPGLLTEMVEPAHEARKLCLLGAFTPTEVIAAIRAKSDIVKIFPAGTGGPTHLAALRPVFPTTVFCPTGRISTRTMGDYYRAGADLVSIGSSLYDKEAFAARDTDSLLAGVKEIWDVAHSIPPVAG